MNDSDVSPAIREGGLVRRLLFRFCCVYLIVYKLPFPLDAIPTSPRWDTHVRPLVNWWHETVLQPYFQIWGKVVPWVGEHVFGEQTSIWLNGSGDAKFNYVQVFCFAMLAFAVALAWMFLDPN